MGAQLEKLFGNPMSEIVPGLFIGTLLNSKDYELMRCHNITHIVSIIDDKYDLVSFKDICYLRINAHDKLHQNIHQYFLQAIQFIHHARVCGGNVLVHCKAGKSRSVSLVIAYLMAITCLSFEDAYRAVKGARNCVRVNFSFQKQLKAFEITQLLKVRLMLNQYFGPTNYFDEIICRQNMDKVGLNYGSIQYTPIFHHFLSLGYY